MVTYKPISEEQYPYVFTFLDGREIKYRPDYGESAFNALKQYRGIP